MALCGQTWAGKRAFIGPSPWTGIDCGCGDRSAVSKRRRRAKFFFCFLFNQIHRDARPAKGRNDDVEKRVQISLTEYRETNRKQAEGKLSEGPLAE